MIQRLKIIPLILLLIACSHTKQEQGNQISQEPQWIQLFDGESLNGWTPKFVGHEAGVNYKNTFRVTDSLLTADYSDYDTFQNEFGHLVHDSIFVDYRLRAEYRFVGDQPPGGEPWAFANNGLMLHCQPAQTMAVDQEFPLSIEYQLHGGNGTEERTTANLCTPGCHVYIADTLTTTHCISSSSKTYPKGEWVVAEAIVYHDSLIYHIMDSDTVLTYRRPVVGGELKGLDSNRYPARARMSSGRIAIQAESHGIAFRKIEVLPLK